MKNLYKLIFAAMLLFIVLGCVSVPDEESVVEDEQPVVQEEAVEEEPAPEPEKEAIGEDEVVEAEEETPADEPGVFVVSEEVFTETFQDIENLISDLNGIIRAKNYDSWLTYLTGEYYELYNSHEKLQEISQQPILQKYGIRLRTLRDYFEYVVVPSRSQAKLDDLIFTDNTHIKAIMLINGKRSILYSLEKIDGMWKIGI